jgi:hypothetical protein
MSKNYKNILKIRNKAYGQERRRNLAKEIVKDSSPLPLPLEYEDIDKEFKRWVDEELEMVFEGSKLPTFTLYSNQRFSEFLQSWDKVDEKKNLILNFKTITRENNPKPGTLLGNIKNIPGEHMILMKRVEAYDNNNRRYFIDYKVKQPYTVDMVYTIGLVTNKYELLNNFNQLLNDKFKAINCYIRPNGHFIPMKLNDISDESEYNIDNRTYYSQNYNITVMAYIMPEDSFIVEEIPDIKFIGFDGDVKKGSYAEIEELPCWMIKPEKEKEYEYVPINLKVIFEHCTNSYKFTMDTPFHAKNITLTNVRHFRFFVNDKETTLDENLELKEGDMLKFNSITRFKTFEQSEILIEGFNYREVQKIDGEIEIKENKL